MTLKLHNTLTKKTETFTPMTEGRVSLYTCGPTVYNRLHVGNWTAYIYWDILVRTLIADGYKVERVMNITDVGHLVSDADEGEDKLEKGARREGKSAWEIAKFYSDDFLAGMKKLNLITPEHITPATEYIPQQLDLIRTLKKKGYTYQISDGIYFDTSKFPTYANFAGLDLAAQRAGARVEYNTEKRHPSDFALWKFTPAGTKRDMEWETPADLLDQEMPSRVATLAHEHLQPASESAHARSQARREAIHEESGKNDEHSGIMGFPGWHLECSAMAMDILGPTIDIHTGGIDHIPVHHTNEIAQSEAASSQQFAHYWVHNNHLKVNGTKISKSLDNGYTLDDLAEKGFDPLDFRMFVLQGQYSNEGNFTFGNLTAAKNRRHHWRNMAALRHKTYDTLENDDEKAVVLVAARGAMLEALNDNLNSPEALRVVDEAFSRIDGKPLREIRQHGLNQLIDAIDELLGLELARTTPDISDHAKELIVERQRARDEKDWVASDQLRNQLVSEYNITVRDTTHGSIWEYAD
jgi:cysteinyl-tRNA synthetase